MRTLLTRNIRIEAVWIPGHFIIPANERVDKLAALAIRNSTLIDHQAIELSIEQARSISPWPSKTHLSKWCPPLDFPVSQRKIDSTLLQVATECFCSCRSFHETKKEYSPTCTKCALGVNETLEHFLLHCPGRGLPRRKHLARTPRFYTVEQLCRERPEQIV